MTTSMYFGIGILVIVVIFALLSNLVYIPGNPFGQYYKVLLFVMPAEIKTISQYANYEDGTWNEAAYKIFVKKLGNEQKELQELLALSDDNNADTFSWKTYLYGSPIDKNLSTEKIRELNLAINKQIHEGNTVLLQIREGRDDT